MVGTLFIVEDDPETGAVYLQVFKKLFEVEVFKSGEDCLGSLSEGNDPPDAFLVDFKLSNMNGLDFLKQIRKLDIKAPAVMITGAASDEMALEALSLGVHGILSKPARLEEVSHKLHYLIVQSQSQKIAELLFNEVEYFVDCSEQMENSYRSYQESLEEALGKKSIPFKAMILAKEQEKWRKEIHRARNLVDNLKSKFRKLKEIV